MALFAYGRGDRKITHSSPEKAAFTPPCAGLSCLWRNICKEPFVEIQSGSFQEKILGDNCGIQDNCVSL